MVIICGNELPKENFKMVAVMGLEAKLIEEICEKIRNENQFVVPANYNYSGQTVLSGTEEGIELAKEELQQKGAKRLIELKTSGPFHTEKLNRAKEKFAKELEKVNFLEGTIPVIKNMDGRVYQKNDNMKQILENHMVSPVRFDKAIQQMQQQEIDTYIEIGPGKALSGFIKKENREANVVNICDIQTLNNVLEILK